LVRKSKNETNSKSKAGKSDTKEFYIRITYTNRKDMLIIHNLNKIQYKTLGKKNFYVERITEIFDIDPITSILSNHRYRIEITNRKYALAVYLDRMAVGIGQKNYYLHAISGSPQWLTIGEIKNMDKFLDKIRLVGLG
jgi:hypothetical protein